MDGQGKPGWPVARIIASGVFVGQVSRAHHGRDAALVVTSWALPLPPDLLLA